MEPNPPKASTARSVLDRLKVLVPTGQDLAQIAAATPLVPFSEPARAFVQRLSAAILGDIGFRPYPEMIAFAHWMRRARIQELAAEFDRRRNGAVWQGRGLAFHIAPANVDTIFLYSFMLSLLMGNANVVRLSSKRSAQVEAALALIDRILGERGMEPVRARLALVGYDHDDEITGALSARCDLRVIWGGDETVAAVRRLPLPPNARDLCFPHKWSVSVFDAAAYLGHNGKDELVRRYVNDTYQFGQMACSSPRMMIWRGTAADCAAAGDDFWPLLERASARFDTGLAAIDFVNKRVAEDQIAMARSVSVRQGAGNLVNVVRFTTLESLPLEEHCGAGLFYECTIADLEPLRRFMGRRLQTVVSHGISKAEWTSFLAAGGVRGIDRIAAVGKALEFATVWDGHDLMREFIREIAVDP